MYKTITSSDSVVFDRGLNAAEKDGYTLIGYDSATSRDGGDTYIVHSAIMHKPDEPPTMTAKASLAAVGTEMAAGVSLALSDSRKVAPPDVPKGAPDIGALSINLPTIEQQLQKSAVENILKSSRKRRYIGGAE